MSDTERDDCWNLPRSLVRKRVVQDPAEAAHRIIELQDEVLLLRRDRAGAVDLIERAVYPITAALNCTAHPWHGSDEARKWLLDAARLRGQ